MASILSSLKQEKNITYKHICIDLNQFQNNQQHISEALDKIKKHIDKNIEPLINQYDFINIGLSSWTYDCVQYLLNKTLIDYNGKIILGGYDVTAMGNKDLFEKFPQVNYFMKGYVETALKELILSNRPSKKRIIEKSIDPSDLVSPYLNKILPLNTPKIHWETKRGCPYKCGFCEWGNHLQKNVIDLPKSRLLKEIDLFASSNIKEINVIDGTFNFGDKFIYYLKYILEHTQINVTLQVRIELMYQKQEEFLKLCTQYNHRIFLEFGIQSIHDKELEIIGRKKTKLNQLSEVMQKLNNRKINYRTSIIYAIPTQTIESFQQTIDYIKEQGCHKINAFPLRIPLNAKLQRNKGDYKIKEEPQEMNIVKVVASDSFTKDDFKKMGQISKQLLMDEKKQLRISVSRKHGNIIQNKQSFPVYAIS